MEWQSAQGRARVCTSFHSARLAAVVATELVIILKGGQRRRNVAQDGAGRLRGCYAALARARLRAPLAYPEAADPGVVGWWWRGRGR